MNEENRSATTRTGRVVDTSGRGEPTPSRVSASFAASLLLAALSACGDSAKSSPDPPPAPGRPTKHLAVAQLHRTSAPIDESRVGIALAQLLQLGLRAQPGVLVYPADRSALLELEGILVASRDPERLAALGSLCAVDVLVSGSFELGAGGELAITLELFGTRDGRLLASLERRGEVASATELMLDAADDVRSILDLGRLRAANREAVLAAVPGDLDPLVDFADGRRRLWLSDPRQARSLLDRVGGGEAVPAIPRADLARSLFAVGSVARAIAEADRAVEEAAGAPPWLEAELRAVAADVRGEPAVAVRWRRRLAALRPGDPEPRWHLVRSLLRHGDVAAAEEVLDELRRLAPGTADALRADLLSVELGAGDATAALVLSLASAERAAELGLDLLRAEALGRAGEAHLRRGEADAARAAGIGARQIFLDLSHRRQAATALVLVALGHFLDASDRETGRRLYRRALQELRAESDLRGVASALHNLAGLELGDGRVEVATTLYEEALEIRQRLTDFAGAAGTLRRLAELERRRGRPEAAENRYSEALASVRRSGNPRQEALLLLELGRQAARQRPGAGEPELRRALEAAAPIGAADLETSLRTLLAQVLLAQGELDAATVEQRQALRAALLLDDSRAANQARLTLASLAMEGGRFDESGRLAAEGLDVARLHDAPSQEALARALLAAAHLEAGEQGAARQSMRRAEELVSRVADDKLRRSVLLAGARLRARLGETAAARATLEALRRDSAHADQLPMQLEAELALGEIDRSLGDDAQADVRLEDVERRAAAAGLVWIEGKAKRARASHTSTP